MTSFIILEEHSDGYMLWECCNCGEEFSNIDVEKDASPSAIHTCSAEYLAPTDYINDRES